MIKKIIPMAVVILLVAGVGGYFLLNHFSSKQRTLRAIKAGNFDEVRSILVEDLELRDNTELSDGIKERIHSLRDRFTNKETD